MVTEGQRFFRNWGPGNDVAGSYNSAGLPELEGDGGGYLTSAKDKVATGVFAESGGVFGNGNPEVGDASRKLIFKASAANSVFGRSATVMPASINQPAILYLGRPAQV